MLHMRVLIGIIATIAGGIIVWKSNWIVNNFGRVPWAEKWLGTEGGSRLFWKLIGLLIIFVGWLYMIGATERIILWIFAPRIPS